MNTYINNMMIVPAFIIGSNHCPSCGSVYLKKIDLNLTESILDIDGFPIDSNEIEDSFIMCMRCKHKFPYLGNFIDGFSIDDGTYTDEPEFEPDSVQINPFYK